MGAAGQAAGEPPGAGVGVVDGLEEAQDMSSESIVVFGSDGGCALFAIDRPTGEVIRLAGGPILDAA